ncbi:MAG: hypothetical protein FWH12_09595 [Treponema sp.]|nr:hypothetical protein [Treponema sp.]
MYDLQIINRGTLAPQGPATSTLLRGFCNILVDPSLPPAEMEEALRQHSGLRYQDIAAVYITRASVQHYAGLPLFTRSRWFTSPPELEALSQALDALGLFNRSKEPLGLRKQLEPSGPNTSTELIAGLRVLTLGARKTPSVPGAHEAHSTLATPEAQDHLPRILLVTSPQGQVCLCGDLILNQDHYTQAHHKNPIMQEIASLADFIVPGHGDGFNI